MDWLNAGCIDRPPTPTEDPQSACGKATFPWKDPERPSFDDVTTADTVWISDEVFLDERLGIKSKPVETFSEKRFFWKKKEIRPAMKRWNMIFEMTKVQVWEKKVSSESCVRSQKFLYFQSMQIVKKSSLWHKGIKVYFLPDDTIILIQSMHKPHVQLYLWNRQMSWCKIIWELLFYY